MSPRFVSFENYARVEDGQVGIFPEVRLKHISVFGFTIIRKVIF